MIFAAFALYALLIIVLVFGVALVFIIINLVIAHARKKNMLFSLGITVLLCNVFAYIIGIIAAVIIASIIQNDSLTAVIPIYCVPISSCVGGLLAIIFVVKSKVRPFKEIFDSKK